MSREEPDAFEEYSEGRDDERAEIVAWLREKRTFISIERLASEIERGEHLRGDDE